MDFMVSLMNHVFLVKDWNGDRMGAKKISTLSTASVSKSLSVRLFCT